MRTSELTCSVIVRFEGDGQEQIQLGNGNREFNWTHWRVDLNFSELPLEERDCPEKGLISIIDPIRDQSSKGLIKF